MNENLTHLGRNLLSRTRFVLIALCLSLTGLTAYAADVMKNISGVVTDSDGEPLIGATVVVKGTSNACATDVDGKYNIKAEVGKTISVSYVGHKSAEAVVGANNVINFTLTADSQILDEVVVVGYGTVKKKDLTGAVGAVNGDKMVERHTTQLSSALQGAIAGVQVLRTSGSPSAGASSIRVRGVTTMGTSDPLIIVDGMPETSLNNINANDVESISVLKDAASASIYGSRAAAGVILVTTKRAKEKDLRISYNFEYGLSIPAAQPKTTSARRYLEMVNELKYNDNPSGGLNQIYSQEEIENWESGGLTDPDNYPNTDWFDYMVKGSTPRQSHVVTLSGGSKHVKSRATLSYDRNETLLRYVDQGYSRYLARINNDFVFNKYISAHIDANFKYSESVSSRDTDSSVWDRIYKTPAIYAPVWSNGNLGDVKEGVNPYGIFVFGGDTRSTSLRAGGKLGLTITPFKDLTIQLNASPNITFSKEKDMRKKVEYYTVSDINTPAGTMTDCDDNRLTETRSDAKELTTQIIGNYGHKWGKHDFSAMLGYESYYYFHETMSANSKNMTLNTYPYLDSGNAEYMSASGSAYETAYRSIFGRVMYNYDDRYLVQANVRRDGSSRFHKNYRWGNFPSVSVGWVPTSENFMKDVDPKALSFLKVRGSWGNLGNARIGSSYYPYISLMETSKSMYYGSSDATDPSFAQGIAQIQYAIEDITWETTESFDFGIDAKFLNSRLSLTADIYRKNTKDMLLSLDIPKYLGYTNPSQNAGDMHTNGYDIEVGWQDHIGDFTYNVSFNLSDYRSKMGDLKGTSVDSSGKMTRQGSYYQEWYGYIADGIIQNEEELAAAPVLSAATQVGDIKYKDVSGPDGVPDGIISPEYDRVLLGNSLPEYLYGGTIGASWKGFDLNIAFQGVGHQNVRMTTAMVQPFRSQWAAMPAIIDGNYWSSFNTVEQNLAARYPRLTYTTASNNYEMSSYWLFNGAYFRMKNITLGYTVPKNITRRFFVNSLRFYVSANDLFCLNHYPTGYDPERTVTSYPITTQLIFGFNVNF